MGKPRPRRIASDDCAVLIDGAVYYPHEGEYVELYSGVTVGELQAMEHIRRLGVEISAVKGDADEYARTLQLLDPHYEELYGCLASRLVSWDWTDDRGRPLGPPDEIATLRRLRPEELYWLLFCVQGESQGERKNGSRPSQTISSAIESLATPGNTSTEGRSRGLES